MELLPAYRALVASPADLARCVAAGSLPGFLDTLRTLWGVPGADDHALLAAIGEGNRRVLDLPPEALAGHWMAARYHAGPRCLSWRLPDGAPREPFLEDDLLRAQQASAAHQLLNPRTGLPTPGAPPAAPPAGFILHLSRCGSTLVSGALSLLDDAVVLSESPLLTDWLLDATLDPAQRAACLPALVSLQAGCFPGRRGVVKWNAWDLPAWPGIASAFPGVPALLLFRDPVEILASHARASGRHMAGDPSLGALHPALGAPAPGVDLPGHRIRVLDVLQQAMLAAADAPGTRLVDYATLDAPALAAIAAHFGLAPDAAARARIAARLAFHSKDPGQPFAPDADAKRRAFDEDATRRIRAALDPGFQALKARAARDARANAALDAPATQRPGK